MNPVLCLLWGRLSCYDQRKAHTLVISTGLSDIQSIAIRKIFISNNANLFDILKMYMIKSSIKNNVTFQIFLAQGLNMIAITYECVFITV